MYSMLIILSLLENCPLFPLRYSGLSLCTKRKGIIIALYFLLPRKRQMIIPLSLLFFHEAYFPVQGNASSYFLLKGIEWSMWDVTRNHCSLIPLIRSDFWLRDCSMESKDLCQNAMGYLGSTQRMHLNQNFPNSVLEFAVQRESNIANEFFLCLFTPTVHIAVYVFVFLCVCPPQVSKVPWKISSIKLCFAKLDQIL